MPTLTIKGKKRSYEISDKFEREDLWLDIRNKVHGIKIGDKKHDTIKTRRCLG